MCMHGRLSTCLWINTHTCFIYTRKPVTRSARARNKVTPRYTRDHMLTCTWLSHQASMHKITCNGSGRVWATWSGQERLHIRARHLHARITRESHMIFLHVNTVNSWHRRVNSQGRRGQSWVPHQRSGCERSAVHEHHRRVYGYCGSN